MRDPRKVSARELGESIEVGFELCVGHLPFMFWPPDQPEMVDGKFRDMQLYHEAKLRGIERALKHAASSKKTRNHPRDGAGGRGRR